MQETAQAPATAIERVATRKAETAIVRHEPMPLSQMQEWGKIFYQAAMFEDLKNVAQAIVKIKAGDELGITPFAAISGIFIIKGKTMIGAKLQAAIIARNPHLEYEVHQLDETSCTIEFFKRSPRTNEWRSVGISTFTKDDAIAAKLAGQAGSNAAMYVKYPRNMLFARALTNGVSWYIPEVLNGNSGTVGVVNDFDAEEVAADRMPEIKPDKRPDAVDTAAPPAQTGIGVENVPLSHDDTDNSEAIDADVDELDTIELLRAKAMELLAEKMGGDIEEMDKYLKGRVLAKMTEENLESMIGDLEAL